MQFKFVLHILPWPIKVVIPKQSPLGTFNILKNVFNIQDNIVL